MNYETTSTVMKSTSVELQVAELARKRGNRFAIVAGVSVLQRFKTPELAQTALDKNRGYYEYWAGSASVAIDNSEPILVIIK